MRTTSLAVMLLLTWLRGPAQGDEGNARPAFAPEAVEFFEKKIRPLFVSHCYTCHSANTNARGGLRVDDRGGLLVGGNSGAAIRPGKPEESLILQAVSGTHAKLKMPPEKPLAAEEIADLRHWIAAGAAWPAVEIPDSIHDRYTDYDELRAEHWAWQPLVATPAPNVRNGDWPRGEIDRFLLARLEAAGLQPAADADRLTLIRRVSFDLTGLPPSPAEMEAFLKDDSHNAYEKLVDRLLASPAFGERWGRHWLDVARYGESTGSSRNVPYPHAWRYRDYVIGAFNRDKPYNEFVREQIAGDLLGGETAELRDERKVATGLLALGVKDVNQRFKVRFVMDNIDEQIDTISRSFLALTASCARCHDHKFDPIPTADYYALAGILQSTDLCAGVRNKMGGSGLDYYDTQMLVLLETEPEEPVAESVFLADKIRQTTQRIEKVRANLARLQALPNAENDSTKKAITTANRNLKRLQQERKLLTDPLAQREIALGVRDAASPGDTEIRIRGEAEQLGRSVPRGFLSVLPVADVPGINPEQSGRLELAAWLTSEHNPLTPRVMVNRIWKHMFGEGLVRTVDNFGITGDVPSHPELLDHLALQFQHDGWSVKHLVRQLALTRAYQLGSASDPANIGKDPGNRLVWRHSPRRLTAEEIRDTMLAASGALQRIPLDKSPASDLRVSEIQSAGAEAKTLEAYVAASGHRSVYLPLLRGLTPVPLQTFDFAEQGMVTGSREVTTVAPQALYLLNDPFVIEQAQLLSDRLAAEVDGDETRRDETRQIELAYQLTMARWPTSAELARARNYLTEYHAALEGTKQADDGLLAARGAPTGDNTDTADENSGDSPAAATATAGEANSTPKTAGKTRTPRQAAIAADATVAPRRAAWVSFCQALLASAEFRYLK